MALKFASVTAWEQANLLLQPALIRLVDNLRKHLEQSTDWQGQDWAVWPETTTEAEKQQVIDLQQQLRQAQPEAAVELEHTLAQLPTPHPGYLLTSKQTGRQIAIDLWQLQFQVCFRNYPSLDAIQPERDQQVEIDTDLLDVDGEVDWDALDAKAQQVVKQIFSRLTVA
ncbi:hypothetical protein [Trichothermofontia sp.]